MNRMEESKQGSGGERVKCSSLQYHMTPNALPRPHTLPLQWYMVRSQVVVGAPANLSERTHDMNDDIIINL